MKYLGRPLNPTELFSEIANRNLTRIWQFQRKVQWGLREVQGIYIARYVRLDENVEDLGDLARQSNDGRKLENKDE